MLENYIEFYDPFLFKKIRLDMLYKDSIALLKSVSITEDNINNYSYNQIIIKLKSKIDSDDLSDVYESAYRNTYASDIFVGKHTNPLGYEFDDTYYKGILLWYIEKAIIPQVKIEKECTPLYIGVHRSLYDDNACKDLFEDHKKLYAHKIKAEEQKKFCKKKNEVYKNAWIKKYAKKYLKMYCPNRYARNCKLDSDLILDLDLFIRGYKELKNRLKKGKIINLDKEIWSDNIKTISESIRLLCYLYALENNNYNSLNKTEKINIVKILKTKSIKNVRYIDRAYNFGDIYEKILHDVTLGIDMDFLYETHEAFNSYHLCFGYLKKSIYELINSISIYHNDADNRIKCFINEFENISSISAYESGNISNSVLETFYLYMLKHEQICLIDGVEEICNKISGRDYSKAIRIKNLFSNSNKRLWFATKKKESLLKPGKFIIVTSDCDEGTENNQSFDDSSNSDDPYYIDIPDYFTDCDTDIDKYIDEKRHDLRRFILEDEYENKNEVRRFDNNMKNVKRLIAIVAEKNNFQFITESYLYTCVLAYFSIDSNEKYASKLINSSKTEWSGLKHDISSLPMNSDKNNNVHNTSIINQIAALEIVGDFLIAGNEKETINTYLKQISQIINKIKRNIMKQDNINDMKNAIEYYKEKVQKLIGKYSNELPCFYERHSIIMTRKYNDADDYYPIKDKDNKT